MLLGFLFSILAAASFGINAVYIRRGTLTGSAAHAMYVTLIVGLPIFLLTALLSGQLFQLSEISTRNYLLLSGAGVLHFIVGRYCSYRSINAIGANRSTPLQALAMIISVVLAIILLDEQITLPIVIGIIMIIIGPAIIIERKKQIDWHSNYAKQIPNSLNQNVPEPIFRQAEGYLFGLLAAIAWGFTPIMIREALLDANLGLLGGLVSYLAATAVLLLSFALPGQLRKITTLDKKAFQWFSYAGISGTFAQIFWYLSLGLIPVTIAAPLQRTSALFVLFFSFLINRRLESFDFKVIIGIILSVGGSIALVL